MTDIFAYHCYKNTFFKSLLLYYEMDLIFLSEALNILDITILQDRIKNMDEESFQRILCNNIEDNPRILEVHERQRLCSCNSPPSSSSSSPSLSSSRVRETRTLYYRPEDRAASFSFLVSRLLSFSLGWPRWPRALRLNPQLAGLRQRLVRFHLPPP